jgi:anti-sigma B factor antagonist
VLIELRRQDERVMVVWPSGRLDLGSASTFREEVRQLVESGVASLVIDLTGVSFIDSSGLGAVISGLRLTRQAGGDLRLACAKAQVLEVLSLTGLDKILSLYATPEEAFAGC